jgi:hypothetical protein
VNIDQARTFGRPERLLNVSGPVSSAAVVIAVINLGLAFALLVAFLQRSRTSAILPTMIIGFVAVFLLGIAIDRLFAGGKPTPSDDLQQKVNRVEHAVAQLNDREIPGIRTRNGLLETRTKKLETDEQDMKEQTNQNQLWTKQLNDRITRMVVYNHLQETPLPPANAAKAAIAAMRVGSRNGRPVLYVAARSLGNATTISGDISFCPASDDAELKSTDCVSAPVNEPKCPDTLFCSGFPIADGPSPEGYATIPPEYRAGRRLSRILVKLCDDLSKKCDIELSKGSFQLRDGLRRTFDVGDFVPRSDYEPRPG